jgi:hypothetical protein
MIHARQCTSSVKSWLYVASMHSRSGSGNRSSISVVDIAGKTSDRPHKNNMQAGLHSAIRSLLESQVAVAKASNICTARSAGGQEGRGTLQADATLQAPLLRLEG